MLAALAQANFNALALPSVLSHHCLNGVLSHHVARLAALAWLQSLSRHVSEQAFKGRASIDLVERELITSH